LCGETTFILSLTPMLVLAHIIESPVFWIVVGWLHMVSVWQYFVLDCLCFTTHTFTSALSSADHIILLLIYFCHWQHTWMRIKISWFFSASCEGRILLSIRNFDFPSLSLSRLAIMVYWIICFTFMFPYVVATTALSLRNRYFPCCCP
jgi:hypothetical protein